jgi:integrase
MELSVFSRSSDMQGFWSGSDVATRREKNGKVWWEDVVHYPTGERDERGRPAYTRRFISQPTKAKVLKLKQDMIAERDGKPRAEDPRMLLGDLYMLVKDRHVSRLRPKSQYVWRAAALKRMSRLFHIPIGELTTERIDKWMSELAAETKEVVRDGQRLTVRAHGDRSINLARGCLVTTLNKGRKWGYVGERNVAEHADKFREDTRTVAVYTPDEIALIAETAHDRWTLNVGRRGYARREVLEQRGARDMAMVFVLAFCGLRISELFALRWVNVHPTFLIVEHSLDWTVKGYLGPVKTGKPRKVPLLPEARLALEWWRELALHTARYDFVFSSARHAVSTPMDRDGWRAKCFNPSARTAGFPEATPHFMRHTFVSLMRKHGFSSSEVGEFIGDTVAVVDRIYTHSYNEDLTDRLEELSTTMWS